MIMEYNREIHGVCESIISEAKAIRDYTWRVMETQSAEMREVYENNRKDELPHIQNLVVALTEMLNNYAPTEAARMDAEREYAERYSKAKRKRNGG